MSFATSRGLAQSCRSIFQKSAVLGSGSHEYIFVRGYAKLKKKYVAGSNLKGTKARGTPEKSEENCAKDQVVNCTNEQANCTNEQVANCSSYQPEDFCGEDFCGEDFCGEVFSGGEDFCGDEFHGEDFDKEEFEGDKIFRSVELTRVPISSKTASRVDDFMSYIFNKTHQDEEE
ncbi:hypothetical protein POM88_047957 [Heracleum sosnowskyi]|uniref:Uncharacterized protein n=1 Tax=Heracleum sosnowskyi TaxID=360622 RepID=A0AAD8GVC3_9APIA|nr:hypothetical protein POM88_047957 [Heracleum sosnowskyi]